MHSMASNGVTFHHHGDFSGEVEVTVPIQKAEIMVATVSVKIPMEAIKNLVAEWKRSELISKLEGMTYDQILKY